MITNTGMSNAIREGNLNMLKSGIQSGASQGMVLMDTALEKLVQSGKADPEDVYLKSGDKQRFGRYLPNKPELK